MVDMDFYDCRMSYNRRRSRSNDFLYIQLRMDDVNMPELFSDDMIERAKQMAKEDKVDRVHSRLLQEKVQNKPDKVQGRGRGFATRDQESRPEKLEFQVESQEKPPMFKSYFPKPPKQFVGRGRGRGGSAKAQQ